MANGTIAFDTLQTSGQIQGTAKSVDTDYVVNGSARVWVNYDLNGTSAYRVSFNASSLTDNGTGDQTITISTAMANATYSHTGMAGLGNTNLIAISQCQDTTAVTTTATRYQTCFSNGNLIDCTSINNSLFGDLA